MHQDRLVPLKSLPDFDVSDGHTDIRGFDAFLADGRRVGRVDELLVDTGARRVAAITLDGGDAMMAGGAAAPVPIESVEIDSAARRVLIEGEGAEALAASPLADEDATLLTPAARDQGEQRLTLAREELDLHKERVSAGAVNVQKRVETRHVRESVPVMHEEVTVERRAAASPHGSTEVRYEGDAMVVPIVEEELVVQKRTVVREELVIRRRQVQRDEVVEADLRLEHVDVDGPGGTVRGAAPLDDAEMRAGDAAARPDGGAAGGGVEGVRVR